MSGAVGLGHKDSDWVIAAFPDVLEHLFEAGIANCSKPAGLSMLGLTVEQRAIPIAKGGKRVSKEDLSWHIGYS